jgi:capsid assembly protease
MSMTDAAGWIFSHRWAILPEMLEMIIAVASREASFDDLRKQAIAAKDAEPLPGARRAEVRDGVAIIPVIGPIFPRSNMMTWLSGATSCETLAKDFTVALESKDVGAIVLKMDTPGGEVTGVNEFANMIFEGRKVKPITAYGIGNIASAGYWIGSAAGEIVADATAELGSIGVVAAYRDNREKEKKDGVRTVEIVSSVSPNKRPDIQSDEGRAQIQAIVDDLAGIFVSTVARNRGVTNGRVISEFGQGGMLVGQRAVAAGLADRIGSFEGVIAEMKDKIRARKSFTLTYGGY